MALSRGGRAGVLALATLVSVALGVGVGELLVRGLAAQQLVLRRPDLWLPVDTLGWTKRPHVRLVVNTGEGAVPVFTDELGYRVGAAERRAEPRRRILLLGDSFMEALQVAYEESTAARLERGLAQRLGDPVAVDNAAVGGWGPVQYYYAARKAMEIRTYDLVLVLLYSGNDLVSGALRPVPPRPVSPPVRLRWPQEFSWRAFVDAVLYPANEFLETRSHLYVLARRALRGPLTRARLTADYVPAGIRKAEADSPVWEATADVCARIAELAAERGSVTLFVRLPTPFEVDEAEYRRLVRGMRLDPASLDLAQPRRRLREEFEARGLVLLDAWPALVQAHAAGERLYGRVDPHFTAAGHGVVAELIEPVAAALLGTRDVRKGPPRTAAGTGTP